MVSKRLVGLAVVIVALLAVGAYFVFAPKPQPNGSLDEFAACVSAKGAKLYGAFWCPHCKEQKDEFGDSLRLINYIECSTPDGNSQMPVCATAGIEGYPTWVFADGSKVPGKLSFTELAAQTGCTAPK